MPQLMVKGANTRLGHHSAGDESGVAARPQGTLLSLTAKNTSKLSASSIRIDDQIKG
jgi:hypothetical protein